jgi:hypothetical protein
VAFRPLRSVVDFLVVFSVLIRIFVSGRIDRFDFRRIFQDFEDLGITFPGGDVDRGFLLLIFGRNLENKMKTALMITL